VPSLSAKILISTGISAGHVLANWMRRPLQFIRWADCVLVVEAKNIKVRRRRLHPPSSTLQKLLETTLSSLSTRNISLCSIPNSCLEHLCCI
jgi:hypothetical protein